MRNNLVIFAIIGIVLVVMGYYLVDAHKQLEVVRADNVRQDELLTGDGDINEKDPTLKMAQDTLGQANNAISLAFNLLGLFEAMSLAVTIGGVVLVSLGLTRFNDAQIELVETRQHVQEELEGYRQRFESEIEKREAELKILRSELEAGAAEERKTTANALLANALIPIGERQYKASDYKGAMNTYHRALELDPINPVVNQRLAYVHTHMGDLENAKLHYEKAIAAEADFAPALAGLGFVYRRFAERLDSVVGDDTLPDEERVQKRLERNQLLNQAEHYLQRALQISPKLVDDDGESWWGVLGGLYKRRGQIKQAIEAYREVTVVTPQSSYGFNNLAQLYMRQGDNAKMLETFEHVERIASKEADATQGNFWGYSDLIVSSYTIGKHEEAREALPIAISIAPVDSPFMLEGLVETLREIIEHVAPEKQPPIREAITILDEEMARRAAHMQKLADVSPDGVAKTADEVNA